MSEEKNWFEPLHRLSTAHTLLFAVVGAPAMTGILQAFIGGLDQKELPFWSYLMISAGLGLLICAMLLHSSRSTRIDNTTYGREEFLKWVGQMIFFSAQSEVLKEDLARLEYEWEKAGEHLVYPLADNSLPSPGKGLTYLQRELLGFRFRYRAHVLDVELVAGKEFRSSVTDNGFPCSFDSYRIKQILDLHAADIKMFVKAKESVAFPSFSSVVP